MDERWWDGAPGWAWRRLTALTGAATLRSVSTLATIREHGLIAVIDLPIAERVFDWGMAVSKGGIELLGIPATLPNVTEVISDLDDANLTVGLTGVLRAEQVSIAVAAGAEFLITPIAVQGKDWHHPPLYQGIQHGCFYTDLIVGSLPS